MSTAYWCVLAAAVLPYVTVVLAKARGTYDNARPRDPESFRGLAQRAHSAHLNGFEAFPIFAIAVLVASGASAKVSIPALDDLALAWVALRLVYIGLYLGDRATARSIVWFAGFVVALIIFTMYRAQTAETGA